LKKEEREHSGGAGVSTKGENEEPEPTPDGNLPGQGTQTSTTRGTGQSTPGERGRDERGKAEGKGGASRTKGKTETPGSLKKVTQLLQNEEGENII